MVLLSMKPKLAVEISKWQLVVAVAGIVFNGISIVFSITFYFGQHNVYMSSITC